MRKEKPFSFESSTNQSHLWSSNAYIVLETWSTRSWDRSQQLCISRASGWSDPKTIRDWCPFGVSWSFNWSNFDHPLFVVDDSSTGAFVLLWRKLLWFLLVVRVWLLLRKVQPWRLWRWRRRRLWRPMERSLAWWCYLHQILHVELGHQVQVAGKW